jgi:hypothetical protein
VVEGRGRRRKTERHQGLNSLGAIMTQYRRVLVGWVNRIDSGGKKTVENMSNSFDLLAWGISSTVIEHACTSHHSHHGVQNRTLPHGIVQAIYIPILPAISPSDPTHLP